MNCLATRGDLERFRSVIMQQVGLQFDDAKLEFLREVLQRRLTKLGVSSDSYVWGLEYEPSRGEFAALARELTVGETYFFRNIEQFRALAEVVLPERMSVSGTPGTLHLLSAGCASGEEAYTLAIVAQENLQGSAWDVQIRAVDLNPAVLEKAAQARYTTWALRETPPDIQRKWFHADGRELMLDEAVRRAVKFDAGNLASDDPSLWQPATYDVIFCRNVLMYFSSEQMRATIARIAQSLVPGGFLFLGHAETLRGISDQFHLRHSHGTFYYELKENAASAQRTFAPSIPRPHSINASIMAMNEAMSGVMTGAMNDGWVDTIRKATERVATLVPVPSSQSSVTSPPSCAWNLAPAFDLMRKERFAEALEHVRSGPAAAEKNPDVLLLEATLLVHSGQTVAAEDACLRLLLVDEFNAGAHYVLALCREHSNHADRAMEHDRVAAYLDPVFAMPRLHMGLIAARIGDRETARRELMQALVLLKQEDASRLLLFGGGFNREALAALCESALRESGGRP